MQTETIKDQVKAYVLESTFAEKEKIKEDTLIFQEGFFDSMGFVMLLGFIEESYGITPADAELIEENFESINAITEFVVNHKAA